jgi:S-adenosylmethionine hydrolase
MIITLTSDIGLTDYLPAACKGILLRKIPHAQIIDVSHQIAPFNLHHASYVCRGAFPHFPEKTIHIILVDLFDQKPDYLLLAEWENQYICCADNGLLTMIVGQIPMKLVKIPIPPIPDRNTLVIMQHIAQTLAELHAGKPMEALGIPSQDIQERNRLQPISGDDFLEGQIIFIDNFENVVVNITREQFETHRKGRKFAILFRRNEEIHHISETYADVSEGNKVVIFNAAGYLEIGIKKQNAAGLFGLSGVERKASQQTNVSNWFFYQRVQVIFE